MNIGSISSLAASLFQPATASSIAATAKNTDLAAALAIPRDASPQISGTAQFLNTLQQMATANPTKFKQAASELSSRFAQLSTQAQSQGNTTQATQLTNLAKGFQTASQTGSLPSSLTQQQHHHHSYGSSQSNPSDLFSLLNSPSTSSTTPSIATFATQ